MNNKTEVLVAKYGTSAKKSLDWLTDLNQVSGGTRDHSLSHEAFHLLKNGNTSEDEKPGFYLLIIDLKQQPTRHFFLCRVTILSCSPSWTVFSSVM